MLNSMFKLINLNDVRKELISEIELDISENRLYLSDRLNYNGKIEYPKILLEAAHSKNVEGFIDSLSMQYFNSHYQRKNPKGGYTEAKIPYNANETLCEGEFNRFYIRAVCLKSLSLEKKFVMAYRARFSSNPRPESIVVEGKKFDAEKLLNDLRINIGVDTFLGLPPGPNSGISTKLID